MLYHGANSPPPPGGKLELYLPQKVARAAYFYRSTVLCHQVFFRMYLPLEVRNRTFIKSLGFVAVETPVGALSVQYTHLGPRFLNEGQGEYIGLQVLLIIVVMNT